MTSIVIIGKVEVNLDGTLTDIATVPQNILSSSTRGCRMRSHGPSE